jgi:predicted ABC-class ATPase
MAAAIQEAVEAGAKLILIDEDTSATNLLFYDERAAPLLRRKTVTTIAEQAASMASKGVSLVIVSSGSMPLIASADTVIVMEDYVPRDATDEARRLASRTGYAEYSLPANRVLVDVPKLAKPKLRGSWLVAKGLEEPLDLESNEQLVEEGQLRLLVVLASKLGSMKGMLMRDIVRRIDQDAREGFQRLIGGEPGPGYAEVRGIDVVHMVNRIPGIRVRQAQKRVNE